MSLSTSGGGGGKPLTLNGLVNAPCGPRKKFTRTLVFTPGGAGLWMCAATTLPTGMVVVSCGASLVGARRGHFLGTAQIGAEQRGRARAGHGRQPCLPERAGLDAARRAA